LSYLENALQNPSVWIDPKIKGVLRPFAVWELMVLEYGSTVGAARVVEKLGFSAVSVASAFDGSGLAFEVSTPGAKASFTLAFANVVAACFGKAVESGFFDNDRVVVVTLLVVHETAFQVVSFKLRSKDKDRCKMLINQKGGIGKMFLESKFVTGDTVSDRTRALLGAFRGGGDNSEYAGVDLAARFGTGWTSVGPDDVLYFSTGLGRISRAVAADRREDGAPDVAPSLADVMANASSELTLGGLFKAKAKVVSKKQKKKTVGGAVQTAAAATPGREVKCWTEDWETALWAKNDPDVKRRFARKYLWAMLLDEDDPNFEGEVVGIEFYEGTGEWVAKVRVDDQSDYDCIRMGSLPKMIMFAQDIQPPGYRVLLPHHHDMEYDLDDEPSPQDDEASMEDSDSDDDSGDAAEPDAPQGEKRRAETPSNAPPQTRSKRRTMKE
jgi:hypothetical protein